MSKPRGARGSVPGARPPSQRQLRVAPDLSFVADTSIDYAMHVDELLRAPDVARDLKRD